MVKNVKSNLAKYKKQQIPFTIKYKSKKEEFKKGCSINILAKKWNTNGFYSDIFNTKKIKAAEKLPEVLKYTGRLLKTGLNKYYICIPQEISIYI